jgi:UDP-glucose 4-epimerase
MAAKKVLICGGAGFIGSHLVDRFIAEGHEVDVVDNLSTGSLVNLAEARNAAGRFKFQNIAI